MREADQIERISCEAQSVANLLDEDAGSDERKALCSDYAQIDIDDIGQGDAKHQRPQHLPKPILRDKPSADDAASKQPDDSQRAIYKAVLHIGQCQSAFLYRALQEEWHNFSQQAFRQTEKQDEEQSCNEIGFGEEDTKGQLEIF